MTKPLDEAKETLDRLLGEFRTGELVGSRLKKIDSKYSQENKK